jgi:hypothetical protein
MHAVDGAAYLTTAVSYVCKMFMQLGTDQSPDARKYQTRIKLSNAQALHQSGKSY